MYFSIKVVLPDVAVTTVFCAVGVRRLFLVAVYGGYRSSSIEPLYRKCNH